MKRILVIGCPGSGKTTFSKKLSQKLNIDCVHLDKMFWKEGWEMCSRDEFDIMLKEELQKEEWIIDGNYSRTLPLRLVRADTVIFFNYSRILCLFRVLKRVIKNYGVTRSDMGNGCPERFDMEFMKYVWTFKKKECDKIVTSLAEQKDINVITINNKREYKDVEKLLL